MVFLLLKYFFNCFILFRNLHVIKSEFFDLNDVNPIKRIEIKPKRTVGFGEGWTLEKVK